MKQQVAASLAGIMLLSSGYENLSGKTLFAAKVKKEKPVKKSQEEILQIVGEKNIHDQWQGKSNSTLYHGGFFVQGDFLYWRADEEGLEYGVHAITTSDTSKEHVLMPKTTWDAGVRVAVGYTFSQHDDWNLTAAWTHFKTHQSAKKTVEYFDAAAQTYHLVVPTWGSTLLGSTANRASVHWNLSYNTYDLDVGRSYFVSKTFALHPFLGLRGAVIDQKYHASYHALLPSLDTASVTFRSQNDFWGMGAHLGTGLQWYCTKSFSFIGRAAASLLYADFHLRQTSTPVIDSSGTTRRSSLNDHETTGATNLEAMLGIQWEMFFYQNKYRLTLSAGYEWIEWFAQNRMVEENSVPNSLAPQAASMYNQRKGDLTLQGATFQARWDF